MLIGESSLLSSRTRVIMDDRFVVTDFTVDIVYQSSYLECMWVHWGPQISATILRYAFCKSLLQELAQADAVERHRAREKESTLELVRNCQ